MPKRVSLRDIEARDVAPRVAKQPATPAPEPERAPSTPRATRPKSKPHTENTAKAETKAKVETKAKASTLLLGIYMRPELYADAKAAFIADFDHRPEPEDAFQRWVSRAIREHATKTPAKRAAAAAQADEYTGEGAGRSWTVPIFTDDSDLMDEAITEDRRTGTALHDRSPFAVDALRVAVAEARHRAGGALPEPPARLPRKLR